MTNFPACLSHPCRQKIKKLLLGSIFFLLPLIIYFPIFVNTFGMHDDYSLLPGDFQNRQMHAVFGQFVIKGRVLGGVLLSFLSWCVNEVSDLVFVRLASFLCMLSFVGLFAWFLYKRLRFHCFWVGIIAFNMIILTTTQLYNLWAVNFIPGFFTLLLTVLSYFLWDRSIRSQTEGVYHFKNKRIFFIILSVLLFLSALFIYPPNALFVFVCTFSIVVSFSPWKFLSAIKVVYADVLFFGFNMFVYFILNVFLVFPMARSMWGNQSVDEQVYNFELTAKLSAKISLAIETWLAALGGVWHPIFGNASALISASVILLCCFMIFFIRKNGPQEMPIREKIIYLSQILAIGLVSFFFINMPSFLAKDCYHLIGYRLLIPSVTLMLVGQYRLMQKCEEYLKSDRMTFLMRTVALGLVISGSLIAFWNIRFSTKYLAEELIFIQTKVSEVDLKKIKRFKLLMLPNEKNPAEMKEEQPFPFEWDYFRCMPSRLHFLVEKIAKDRGAENVSVSLDQGNPVFIDRYTAVIDLNSLIAFYKKGWPSRTTKSVVLITTSADSSRGVEVVQSNEFLNFNEVLAGKTIPYWTIDVGQSNSSWIQLEFLKNVQPIKALFFRAVESDLKRVNMNFRVFGSFDGNKWTMLSMEEVVKNGKKGNYKNYFFNQPNPYKKYKFYFYKDGPQTSVNMIGIFLKLI